jgi:hypothetical protein
MTYTWQDFGPDKSGPQFVLLRERLALHGHIQDSALKTLKDCVQEFQLAQGWTGTELGGGADGWVGPETWRRLQLDPKPPAPPNVLELSKFKRTLPTGEPDHPTEVYPLTDTTTPVTFRAPVDGVTTENTDYSRDELREMHPKSWSADDGKHHKLEAICRVTEMPGRKTGSKYVPGTVIGQFHDKSDDIVILLVNVNGQVIVEEGLGPGNGSEKHVLFTGYRLGDELHYFMDAHGEGIDVTVNGHHVRIDKVAKDAYGKAGVYNRGNETNATGASSADFLKLKASHA